MTTPPEAAVRPPPPWTPEGRQNPHPWFTHMLEHEPVAYHDDLGVWGIFKERDVTAVFRDEEHWSVAERIAGFAEEDRPYLNVADTVVGMDPPEHTRVRRVMNPAFFPRKLDNLRPRIDEIADDLLAQAIPKGTFDFVNDYAYPLPLTVIAEILGVPVEDRPLFQRLAEGMEGTQGAFVGDKSKRSPEEIAAARKAVDEYRAYFEPIFEDRRQHPRDDMISTIVQAQTEDKISRAELSKMAMLILGAGSSTTKTLITNCLIELMRHPEATAKLRENPDLIPSAIEEVLRFHSPAMSISRKATRDVEVRGKTIPKGAMTLLWLQGANLDPEVFPDALTFDIERSPNRHVGFAVGHHVCIGAPLARMEAEIALRHWLRATKDFKRADEGPYDIKDGLVVVVTEHLPVTVTPA